MVFESIVVDLVNRYLGDFIENLDTSQLKIGIWGGKAVAVGFGFAFGFAASAVSDSVSRAVYIDGSECQCQ